MMSFVAQSVELLKKISLAEDQLQSYIVEYHNTVDQYEEELENWAMEIKEEKIKIHETQEEIKQKESELEEIRNQFTDLPITLEEEKMELRAKIQKAKEEREAEAQRIKTEEGIIGAMLLQVEDEQKNLMLQNRWTKFFLDKELAGEEKESNPQLKDETKKIISKNIASKLELLDQDLIEVARAHINVKQKKLKELEQVLAELVAQCEEIKNKKLVELEHKLQLLEK